MRRPYPLQPGTILTARRPRYHVPQNVQEHIDYIKPGTLLAASDRKMSFHGMGEHSRPAKIRPLSATDVPFDDLSKCDKAITPDCIKALYKIPPAISAQPNNSLGIFEEGDYYSQEDLDLFFKNMTSFIPQGTHPTPAFIDGAQAPVPVSQAGGESDLDFELAYPIVYPQTITLYQTDDFNYATNDSVNSGFLNTFLDAIDGVRRMSSHRRFVFPLTTD